MQTNPKQKKAARKIADIMYTSLQQFSEEEQQERIKEVEKIASKIHLKPTGKPPKPSSTRATVLHADAPRHLAEPCIFWPVQQ